jgi:hypothetical protein
LPRKKTSTPDQDTPPVANHGETQIRLYGIRHHGPGSARSLIRALEDFQPDAVLIEGPPDADDLIALVASKAMKPPVALMVYAPDEPKRAGWFPFAVFSPEWQAMTYALENRVEVRFIDLPQTHAIAIYKEVEDQIAALIQKQQEQAESAQAAGDDAATDAATQDATGEPHAAENDPAVADGEMAEDALDAAENEAEADEQAAMIRQDPLTWMAHAAGYADGERWWDRMIEGRVDSTGIFDAILEAMTELRGAVEALRLPIPPELRDLPLVDLGQRMEALREAHMRRMIRAARDKGRTRIAVVCGAWHTPALVDLADARSDDALLTKLPKIKVQSTWVPWTYGRLARMSGYGAGIESPGWYHHLWATTPEAVTRRWLARVAALLREAHLDASTAQVIDAARLVETLTALRGYRLPGLEEMNEAVRAVLTHGSDLPMQLVFHKLIVSETMGDVPPETPTVPLQQDLTREQKRLRLKMDATPRELDLDLRQPINQERSHLLHRLILLNIPWGRPFAGGGQVKGTFHEYWTLQWQPEFSIAIVEASVWGNTLEDAADAALRDLADQASDLRTLTGALDSALLADLPGAVSHLMTRLSALAALTGDTALLMDALPPLARVLRYGSVRSTDAAAVSGIVGGMVTRITIGLPLACASLDDAAAGQMFERLMNTHAALTTLQDADYLRAWHDALSQIAARDDLHGLVTGRCCRLLLDSGEFSSADAGKRMKLALSAAGDPAHAAAWIEGFLRGSGLILLHDDALLEVIDQWVAALDPLTFKNSLPLLRRTFSTFAAPERRQIGEKARGGVRRARSEHQIDPDRAARVLPLLEVLLGLAPAGANAHLQKE